jgi:translation initiation factor 2 subunit 3
MALGKSDILSGNITSTKNNLPETTQKIKIKIEMFKTIYLNNKETKLEPIKPSEMLMISLNTTITGGNVLTIKNEIIEMNLKTPIVPFENEYVGIAKNIEGHWRLIGFGNLIK